MIRIFRPCLRDTARVMSEQILLATEKGLAVKVCPRNTGGILVEPLINRLIHLTESHPHRRLRRIPIALQMARAGACPACPASRPQSYPASLSQRTVSKITFILKNWLINRKEVPLSLVAPCFEPCGKRMALHESSNRATASYEQSPTSPIFTRLIRSRDLLGINSMGNGTSRTP